MVATSPCALAVAPLAYATAISACASKVMAMELCWNSRLQLKIVTGLIWYGLELYLNSSLCYLNLSRTLITFTPLPSYIRFW